MKISLLLKPVRTCIREVHGSNLGSVFRDFPLPIQGNVGTVPSNMPRPFPYCSYLLITNDHLPSTASAIEKEPSGLGESLCRF